MSIVTYARHNGKNFQPRTPTNFGRLLTAIAVVYPKTAYQCKQQGVSHHPVSKRKARVTPYASQRVRFSHYQSRTRQTPANFCRVSVASSPLDTGRTVSKRIGTALATLALCIVGACGSSEDVGATPQTLKAESTTPTDAPTQDATPTEAAGPRKASCKLKGSNASATLEDNADNVVLTFSGEPVASTDTTGYYADVYDADGNGGQIGAKFLDGDPIAYFTAVESDMSQTNTSGSPRVDGDKITMTFPKSDGGLGDLQIAKWNAAFSLAGTDVGLCPGNYESQPFPG